MARVKQTIRTKKVWDSILSLGIMFDFLSDVDILKQKPATMVDKRPIRKVEFSGSDSLAPS